MKKILFSLCLLFLFISGVSADSLNPNFEISEEGYEILSEFMSDTEISMISEDTYEKFLNEETVGYYSYIVEETYVSSPVQLPRKVNEVYMTVDEYVNRPATAATCIYGSDGLWETCETTKKWMRLHIATVDSYKHFNFVNEWLSMPKYKSFDVIGLRWTDNFTMIEYDGNQFTDGNTSYVDYAMGNGNYKLGTNAIGLSQNLVDSATNVISNEITVTGTCNGSGAVWATYQHAQANITLATSKKYNFSASGMGGVLAFYGNASGIYDNTTGLSLTYTC